MMTNQKSLIPKLGSGIMHFSIPKPNPETGFWDYAFLNPESQFWEYNPRIAITHSDIE